MKVWFLLLAALMSLSQSALAQQIDHAHIKQVAPDPISRRIGYVQPRGTFNTDWISPQGVQSSGTPTISVLNGIVGMSMAGTATSGADNYFQDSAAPNLFEYQNKPLVHMLFAPVDSTNVRYWFGIFSGGPFDLDTLSSGGIQGVGLRFSTVAGDTTWKFVTCDGTTDHVVDTGLPLNANVPTDWFFDLYTSPTTISLYRNGSFVTSSSTNLPASSTPMCWFIRQYTQENVSKSFWMGRVEWNSQ